MSKIRRLQLKSWADAAAQAALEVCQADPTISNDVCMSRYYAAGRACNAGGDACDDAYDECRCDAGDQSYCDSFTCDNGTILGAKDYTCDGYDDCGDGSDEDEDLCEGSTTT